MSEGTRAWVFGYIVFVFAEYIVIVVWKVS